MLHKKITGRKKVHTIFFENYWNDGSIKEQKRYFDNIVVSTERIGCCDSNVQIKYLLKKNHGRGRLFFQFEPFKGDVRIFYNAVVKIQEPVQIVVYNLRGISIRKHNTDTDRISKGYVFNIGGLPNGVYFVRVKIKNINLSTSFLKVF